MPEAKTISAPAINIVDESFDIKKSGSYHLSILSNDSGMAFTILDTSTNPADSQTGKYLVLYYSPSAKTEELIAAIKKLGSVSFQSISCAVAHNKFTIVPSAIFDEENKESFFGFNYRIQHNEKIHVDILNNIEAKNLFTISVDFENMIRKHFSNARFIHNSTSFIEGLLIQNKNNAKKKVFADFHSSYFEVIILNGRELLFSNAFQYKAPEDIAYYLLFIYEQLQLNPEEIELVLSGEIEKTAKEHTLLYNYIRNVKFATRPDEFKYSYKFEEVPSHNLFSLFTQYLCV